MRLSRLHVPAVALALTVVAAPASAQVASHFDGAMTGWSTTLIVNPSNCASAGGGTAGAGGNPGAYWAFSNYDCYSLMFGAHLSTFSWNPMSQGAITGPLNFGYNIMTNTGGQVAFENVIRQSGRWFVSNYALATYGNGWESASSSIGANAASWCEVYTAFGPGTGYACGGASPDFSSTGSQIDFGVVTANSGSGFRTGGIDNFSVSFAHDLPTASVPEPASLALVFTGVLGLVAVGRRRRA